MRFVFDKGKLSNVVKSWKKDYNRSEGVKQYNNNHQR